VSRALRIEGLFESTRIRIMYEITSILNSMHGICTRSLDNEKRKNHVSLYAWLVWRALRYPWIY
jgi:hypothetical protein